MSVIIDAYSSARATVRIASIARSRSKLLVLSFTQHRPQTGVELISQLFHPLRRDVYRHRPGDCELATHQLEDCWFSRAQPPSAHRVIDVEEISNGDVAAA